MPAISPTAEGFRAAFRRPSLTLGEITWRWVTGATASVVFFYGLYQYLDSLPVNEGELLFLHSGQPYLVSQAIAHILRGTMGRVVLAALLAGVLLGLLWTIAGALGRIATVRPLIEYFHRGADNSIATNPFRVLVRLNFLRVVVAMAAVVGVVGASILAGFVSTDAHPEPGLAFLLFLPLAGLVWLAWLMLNWLLSLAGMFAVRNGEDTVGAISAAVGFCRERTGPVAAVSVWTGLAHVVAFVAMTTIISLPMGFAPILPWRLVLFVMTLIAIAYFALVDWLYTARLAGYVCIVETPQELLRPPAPLPPPALPAPRMQSAVAAPAAPALQTTIDRDEVILSDVPVKLAQTIDRDEVILSDTPKRPDIPGLRERDKRKGHDF